MKFFLGRDEKLSRLAFLANVGKACGEPLFMQWWIFDRELSLRLEKCLHERLAFLFQHTRCNGCLRVECIGGISGVTSLLIASSIHHSRNLCPSDGTSAHHARLHGDVERAVLEIFSTKHVGARGDGLHLSLAHVFFVFLVLFFHLVSFSLWLSHFGCKNT